MKTYIISITFLLGSLYSSAQIQRDVVAKVDTISFSSSDKNKNDKMSRKERFKELDLTREQKVKMKEIMQSGKASKDAIENNAQLSEPEKKKQLRELQKAQLLKIQSILTEEQKAKFQASKQNNP